LINTIYIEHEVADHPRTRRICDRFSQARQIAVENYGAVFNRKAQNFRLQKRQPALILAGKQRNHVLPAPDGYGVGGGRNYYFSHMLNCLYDCRYCFLQGMYRSAHYVVFVNYEDFMMEIGALADEDQPHEPWFFSGYDGDRKKKEIRAREEK
jgi:spore photoproduct lyase